MTFNQTNNNKGDVNNAVATNGNATQMVRNEGEVVVTSNSINTGGGNIDNRGGNIVQARDITHSFNAIAEKTEKQDVAEKLRQLALSLNEILASLPDDVAQRVARDAKSFAEEAAGKKPDEETLVGYWDMIQKGLKKTAEASIPVIAPLIAAVIKAAIS